MIETTIHSDNNYKKITSWLPWLSLVVIYNPLFLYQFLMINFNTGGIERAGITLLFYAASFIFCLRSKIDSLLFKNNLGFIYFLSISFLIFSLYSLFSILLGRDPYTVAVYVFPLLSFCYLTLFTFIIIDTSKIERFIDFLSFWALLMSLFVAYITYLAYTTDFTFAYNIAISGTESETDLDDVIGNRIPDLFLPIYFSIGLCSLFFSTNILRRAIGILILVLSGILLLICFWRTAQLAALFSVLLFFIYQLSFSENKAKNLKTILLTLLISSPFILYILNFECIEGFTAYSLLESRLTDLFTGKSESGSFRLLSVQANLDYALDYWITGLGFGKTIITNNEDLIILGTSSNYFIDLFVWFGLPLILFFLGYLINYIFKAILFLERTEKGSILGKLFLLIVLNCFIILCFFPSVVSYPVLEIIAIFLGTGTKLVYELKQSVE